MAEQANDDSNATSYDAIVIGAGFGGMFMLHRLKQQGLRTLLLERGDDVGGTWYWNRYPGARCDIQSMEYSYQFSEALQQEWEWSEKYATQPEILRYARHVTERFDLRPHMRFGSHVKDARFDESAGEWIVPVVDGPTYRARYCVAATGCLSSANRPDIEGADDFSGATYHTGHWPHEGADFQGKRVAVIGTGSSAIQSIPLIAREAAHLTVLQRSPNFAVPAHNAPLDPDAVAAIKSDYAGYRASNNEMPFAAAFDNSEINALDVPLDEVEAELEQRWRRGGLPFLGAFADLLFVKEANDLAASFIRRKIRERVNNPEVAELLCPESIVGCKRLCVDTEYFETYNRANVRLVDISNRGVERIEARGVRVADELIEVDAIVYATGFDAMTGSLLNINFTGRGGRTLSEKWAAGPRTYLGLGIEGFPNLFTVSGPGSPSVLTNMLPSIEQHVNWIADCIAYLEARGLRGIEATGAAEDDWVAHVNEVADTSLYPGCSSWYLGANVPGKPRVFMPYLGFPPYKEKCDEVAASDYEGFRLLSA
ncbi:MAG: NAD(P)/FAD-dependent oxidoreductase [Pseudomonadota bacterium]